MATVLKPIIKISPELKDQLKELVQDTGKSEAELVEEALAGYITRQKAIIAKVKEGRAAADRGELVDQDDVEAWLDSWGTENELPAPSSKV